MATPTATKPGEPIFFSVPGDSVTTAGAGTNRGAGAATAFYTDTGADSTRWQVMASVTLGNRRAGGAPKVVEAVPELDVVRIQIAGGPALILHPENARDLLLACAEPQPDARGVRRTARPNDDGTVTVPATLRWQMLEDAAPARSRGFLGHVLISLFEVLRPKAFEAAKDFVQAQVVQKVDGRVAAGVYRLRRRELGRLAVEADGRTSPGADLVTQVELPAEGAAKPILVFVHGTFVDTLSTFGKLWQQHPQRVAALFDHYQDGDRSSSSSNNDNDNGDNVYALDHPTISASPMANALTLVRALPNGARLHLATHSRGGLVAECLARVAGIVQAGGSAPTAEDRALFDGPKHALQLDEITQLIGEMRSRRIVVERIVRVACPARGTLLAGKRLDAYLSVLSWTLQATGVPLVPQLVDFITEVARRRADATQLPGLEAMVPDSPVLRWLAAAPAPVPGELRVIAGDMEGDSVGSFLKTLLADAFYWTDNDVVVHTSSMYGGTPRSGGASFLLDQGGKVNHFSYFSNERTVQALVDALRFPGPAPGFQPIGPLSWKGDSSTGTRAAKVARSAEQVARDAAKPAVFVLPGILGSNLKQGSERIWLGLRLVGGFSRLAYRPNGADGVLSDGPIGLVYDALIDHLAVTHEVLPFAFDWRRPIEEEALRLAAAIDEALKARVGSGQPVQLLAHSMGGLVARTVQIVAPQTWQRLMRHKDARLLMLGTPNGGSWAPMQVLSGDDTFGNALAAFGSPLANKDARQSMAQMPGLLQLQAGLLDETLKLDRAQTWDDLATVDEQATEQANLWHAGDGRPMQPVYRWGRPSAEVLAQAVALRKLLDHQRDHDLPSFASKLLLVTGRATFTPDGFEPPQDNASGQSRESTFAYRDAVDGGDGRVPLASALLPGVRTWQMNCEHGTMPDDKRAFAAFVELLKSGDTERLPRLPAAAAATGTRRSRPSRDRPPAAPGGDERAVFRAPGSQRDAAPDGTAAIAALRVRVLNGNLSFVDEPLMLGHTRSIVLTGTEAAVNRLVGNAMRASLDAGLYPDECGTHQVFLNSHPPADNPLAVPRPRAVLVVGLGEEGKLTEQNLARTVCQGVLAWVQREAEAKEGTRAEIDLTATLMGSGGLGMNASNAARAIASGVHEANLRIEAMRSTGSEASSPRWPRVGRLSFVELYLERASDAWNGLQVLADAAPAHYRIEPAIDTGIGPLRRQIDSGYRAVDYDMMAATSSGEDTIEFTLDTKRARTEVRAKVTQGGLLRQLVERASSDQNDDERLGTTLFQLLVPVELEPFLAGTGRMQIDLDQRTASIPWELLDTQNFANGTGDSTPWAIRTKLLRKLRLEQFREQVSDAGSGDDVLVIGEPVVDAKDKAGRALYGPLPGARAEARAVAEALGGSGARGAGQLFTVIGDDADAANVTNALFARRYRIVHVSGHGEPVQRDSASGKVLMKGGVVLSGGTFLSADEIRSMRTVPELVFVNCCHAGNEGRAALGRGSAGGAERKPYNRAEFAAGLAASLIEIGVRCVVAAGWAVGDDAAELFARTFYAELLCGKPFIDAVANARRATRDRDPRDNTWAAYQCYGDPNWTLQPAGGVGRSGSRPVEEEYGGVASALALVLALEQVAVAAEFMGANPRLQLVRTRYLNTTFAARWGAMGCVAEAFGVAYAAVGADADAIAWYQAAVVAADASASMKAHEQWLNLRARHAWATVRDTEPGAPRQHAAQEARQTLAAVVRELTALVALNATRERISLIGSAYKRLALIERTTGHGDKAIEALEKSVGAYRRAEALLAAEATGVQRFYPMQNRVDVSWALALAKRSDSRLPKLPEEELTHAAGLIEAAVRREPDFWTYAADTGLRLLRAAAAGTLSTESKELLRSWNETHARVSSPLKWASVADQAELLLGPLATGSNAEAQAARQVIGALSAFARGAAVDGG